MVVFQYTAKSLTTFDRAENTLIILLWLDQLIIQSLVISLAVIVLDIFSHALLQ